MRTAAVVIAVIVVLVALIIVNAPPPDGTTREGGPAVPIDDVFVMMEAENDSVRQLWAEEIVGAGKEQGMQFSEDWHDEGLDAGPLPALFFRETAESLRRNPVPIYLFLGSDFPINDANKFTGLQSEHFKKVRDTGEPQFFLDPEFGFRTAMFSDVASAEACVICHNAEPDSPKRDWQVGDIMGAATWSYPEGKISMAEVLALLQALRQSVREVYEHYLDKVATFADPPPVGDKWPADGYFLPSADVFMAEAKKRTSDYTLSLLLAMQDGQE